MLTKKIIKEMEELASSFLDEYHILTQHVPVYELMEAEGYHVMQGTFDDSSIAGVIETKEKRIVLSKYDNTIAKRETTAIALGMIRIFKDDDISKVNNIHISKKPNQTSYDEELRTFARMILMPKARITKDWKKYRSTGMYNTIASMYGVSENSLLLRVTQLGLRKPF